MTALVLRAKFEPTPLLVELLDRPHLLARLDEAVRRRLTYVHAPAGYGKTTLLGAWVEARRGRGETSIWVSIDEQDARPQALLTTLAAALADAGLVAMPEAGEADLPPPNVVADWARRLEGFGPCVLILDDFHRARNAETERLLRLLLDLLPRSVHLVLSTRGKCELPVSVLRAQGQLNDINAETLRFTPEEMASILARTTADAEIQAQLGQLTEGWPIAVRLLQLSAPAATHEPVLLAPSIVSEEIRDYLQGELFDPLPEDDKAFLVDMSEFDLINAGLADAVRETQDAADRLSRLVLTGSPLVPADAGARWYRLHPLFRAFLREQPAPDPARRVRLNAVGSEWFAAAGDVAGAVRHAIGAGRIEQAVGALEAAGIGKVGASQGMTPLRNMVETLPESIVARHPHVRLGRAFLFAKDGRIREARELLRRLDDDPSAPSAASDVFARDKSFLEQLLAFYEDSPVSEQDVHRIEGLARDAIEDAPWFVGWVNNLLFMLHFERGSMLGARVAAETALARYGDAGNAYAQLIMQAHLGMLDLAEASPAGAEARLRTTRDAAARSFPSDLALRGLIDIPLAEVLLERDMVDEAAALIWPALDQVERHEGWADLFVRGYHSASRIAGILEGPEAALLVLDRAMRTAAERDLERLARYAEIRRFEILSAMPHQGDALPRLRDRIGSLVRGDGGWRERQLAAAALTREAIRRGDCAAGHASLAALETILSSGSSRQFELQAHILRSLLHYLDHDLDAAAASLRVALGIGAAQGWRRPFLDEEELLASCLIKVAQHSGLASFNPRISAFLTEILAWRRRDLETSEVDTPQIFSRRELEVLRELSLGKANKVIARALRLSEATVKFHLGNVYTKLGVNNRLLAVAVARERLLID